MASSQKKWGIAPPIAYLARAKSFAAAARILNQYQTDVTPYLFCCGQATELALKGLLLVGGASERKFASDLGHELTRAWRCAAKGGAPLAADPPQWCERLNAVHTKPFHSRYPRANTLMGLPAPEVMLAGIEELLEVLRRKLGVS